MMVSPIYSLVLSSPVSVDENILQRILFLAANLVQKELPTGVLDIKLDERSEGSRSAGLLEVQYGVLSEHTVVDNRDLVSGLRRVALGLGLEIHVENILNLTSFTISRLPLVS